MLSLEHLKVLSDNIVSDYDKLRKGKLDISSFRSSTGYQISNLKKYELEDGHYGSRSICIAPDSIQIVDLCLLYNTTEGPGKYILTIRPSESKNYVIYVNKLYLLDEDNYEAPFNKKSLTKSYKLRTKIPNGPKLSKGKSSTSSNKEEIFCVYKNLNCCYTKKDHSNDCKDCCIERNHYTK